MRLTNRQYDALKYQLRDKLNSVEKAFEDAIRAKQRAAAKEFTDKVIGALPQNVLNTEIFVRHSGCGYTTVEELCTAREYFEGNNIICYDRFPVNGKFCNEIIANFNKSLPKVEDIMFKVDFAETGVDITRLVEENYNVDIEAAVKAALE